MIDLGTVASGRMAALESGTEPKAEPNLGFLQVFTGASVYVGLGNSPFVLSGSFAYVPSIRTVTLASGDEPRAAPSLVSASPWIFPSFPCSAGDPSSPRVPERPTDEP